MSINSSLFEGHPGMSKPLMARTVCDENGIRRTYSANAEPGFFFGTDANTTFLVCTLPISSPVLNGSISRETFYHVFFGFIL